MQVSALCLGCMNFGSRTEPDDSISIIHAAIDSGINFIDTANTYTKGRSEEIVGDALSQGGRRDDVVLATKMTGRMSDKPNDIGSSRYSIRRHCEQSLRRLKTDRIDLYQLHWMDLNTPLEESLRALDDLVRQGKVLYIGCSKFAPALTVEAIMLSERYGWAKFVSEQPPYNILDRRIENEMIWTCLRHGIGIIPWGPIAAGILSDKYVKEGSQPANSRYKRMNHRLHETSIDVAREIAEIAKEKGVTAAEYSLAWVMRQPGITAPITGVRTMEQLHSSLKAVDVRFTEEDFKRVNELVPPGAAVSDYYDGNINLKMRIASKIPGVTGSDMEQSY